MLLAILTIVGGLVAASSLIITRQPRSRQMFDKVAPYQGALGVGLLGFGIYHLVVNLLPHLGAISAMPLKMGLLVAGVALDILIGFLLGFGLVSKWISRSGAASDKGKAAFSRLVPIQAPMGLAAVAVGALILAGF